MLIMHQLILLILVTLKVNHLCFQLEIGIINHWKVPSNIFGTLNK